MAHSTFGSVKSEKKMANETNTRDEFHVAESVVGGWLIHIPSLECGKLLTKAFLAFWIWQKKMFDNRLVESHQPNVRHENFYIWYYLIVAIIRFHLTIWKHIDISFLIHSLFLSLTNASFEWCLSMTNNNYLSK